MGRTTGQRTDDAVELVMDEKTAFGFFRTVEPVRASEEIARQIAQSIDAGLLRPDQRLPGERTLADIFGVSRGPVREAMRSLEALGYITVRPGRGATVRLGQACEDDVIRLRFESRRDALVEHFEVHAALFAEACALAARRAGADEVEALEQVLARQAQARERTEKTDLFYSDRDFTCAIARMAHNQTLESMLIESTSYTRSCRITLFALPGAVRAGKSLSEHQRIVEQIRSGDEAQAGLAGRGHVMSALSDWLAFLEKSENADR